MSYNKTTWVNGDIITAAKMNNIENGIESAGDSAYDAILYIYHGPTTSTDYVITVQQGSYAALKEKIMNKVPPVILGIVWDELSQVRATTPIVSLYTYPSTTYPNNSITMAIKIPTSYNGGSYSSEWNRIMLEWAPSNTVSVW